MKHSEKLDLLLKSFYNNRFNGKIEISKNKYESVIPLSNEREFSLLIKRLQDDGYIKAFMATGGEGLVDITSRGIEYCEEDSYSYRGSSIITNNYSISVNNSHGISIVNSSTNVNVNISNIDDIKKKIEQLVNVVQTTSDISHNNKKEMIECIDEIKTSLDQDKKPKFAFDALLAMANNFAGISTLAIEIGKLIFGG
ncbi:hypothetical protein [Sphingobacterium sp. UGAL515B_05]|uniref:hypothetical protein n=1 Tax=Sphingobacterium sp. UGAL515B_05 TaxID=2986767 RepID=UPI002954AE49|nr:hypothetical protein [Sphingobacterium sp. UGAL515B_05]WON92527.1 hypothetical protein OK025_14910 [Sphingobacterium sp. UGAL515B_05]